MPLEEVKTAGTGSLHLLGATFMKSQMKRRIQDPKGTRDSLTFMSSQILTSAKDNELMAVSEHRDRLQLQLNQSQV